MIEVHIKSTPEQRENQEEFSNMLHNALIGWEAYINSDILINVDDEDETLMIIGPEITRKGSVNKLRIDINLSDIKYSI